MLVEVFCLFFIIRLARSIIGPQLNPRGEIAIALPILGPMKGIITARLGHGFGFIASLAYPVILSLGFVWHSAFTPNAADRITSIVTACCHLKDKFFWLESREVNSINANKQRYHHFFVIRKGLGPS